MRDRFTHAAMSSPHRILVVGTGLVGTSVALAARSARIDVLLHDALSQNLEMAERMGAGLPYTPGDQVDLVVLAVPPHAVAAELYAWQKRAVSTAFTDVASVKTGPRDYAARLGCDMSRYVAGHPLAGRERSGPTAASADMFLGRPWALCPGEARQPVLELVAGLAKAVGAEPVLMKAEEHDDAVAALSHAPHVVASVLAGQLVQADTRVAGQGVRDTTRIADGDPGLWTSILTGNAGPVADVVAAVAADLERAAAALRAVAAGDDDAAADVRRMLERGIEGRKRLPGKHGGPTRTYAVVAVVLPDRPGQLAKLFGDTDAVGVNVEDMSIEHSPGALIGLVELSVRPESREDLVTGLRAAGWDVPG